MFSVSPQHTFNPLPQREMEAEDDVQAERPNALFESGMEDGYRGLRFSYDGSSDESSLESSLENSTDSALEYLCKDLYEYFQGQDFTPHALKVFHENFRNSSDADQKKFLTSNFITLSVRSSKCNSPWPQPLHVEEFRTAYQDLREEDKEVFVHEINEHLNHDLEDMGRTWACIHLLALNGQSAQCLDIRLIPDLLLHFQNSRAVRTADAGQSWDIAPDADQPWKITQNNGQSWNIIPNT